jgi:hypothetical protein
MNTIYIFPDRVISFDYTRFECPDVSVTVSQCHSVTVSQCHSVEGPEHLGTGLGILFCVQPLQRFDVRELSSI